MRKKKYPYKYKIPWLKKQTKIRKNPRRHDIPKSVAKTYNVFTTANKIEAFHPQFIGIDKDSIKSITSKDETIEITTKPSTAKVTLFKGSIPLTHVNIMKLRKVI